MLEYVYVIYEQGKKSCISVWAESEDWSLHYIQQIRWIKRYSLIGYVDESLKFKI